MSKIKIIGMSDALTLPTGFGRVSRELFSRLPQDKFDLAFLAGGWPGTTRYPGVKTYSGYDRFCQGALVKVAFDFAGKDNFILWTLFDPWQVGWISNPDDNEYATEVSTAFIKGYRDKFRWVGHWPIDGYGPRDGPPLFFEDYIKAMDYPVAMADFGRKLMKKVLPDKDIRFITHAIDGDRYFPLSNIAAKAQATEAYRKILAANFAARDKEVSEDERKTLVEKFVMHLEDRFVVLVVMANRQRKYWIEVLQAFKAFVEMVPNAALVGVCADRVGRNSDSWPLTEYAAHLGLRVDRYSENPNVWLMDSVGGSVDDEDSGLRLLYGAADVTVLLSGGEGFGLPQLESHACAKPCFVGNYSASAELMVDPREGISPRGFNYIGLSAIKRPTYAPSDLRDKLVYAYKNPSWRLETGLKGVKQAEERDWVKILPLWVSLFEEAAGGTIEEEKPDESVKDAVPDATGVGSGAAPAVPAGT